MENNMNRPVEILLVEDNPGDVRLTQEAFNEGKIKNNLHIVGDGIEALKFLRNEGDYTNAPRPDLVLLDLNMPRMGGREVLENMKADSVLKSIPVVILTTSEAEQDILKSYDLQANCYITKPVDIVQFFEIIHYIEDFWFSVVRLPRG